MTSVMKSSSKFIGFARGGLLIASFFGPATRIRHKIGFTRGLNRNGRGKLRAKTIIKTKDDLIGFFLDGEIARTILDCVFPPQS